MANSAPASIATHTRVIYPPPYIRTIADKVASFVARNGPEFEKRITASNAGNPKFNFLNGSDAYHAYYQHKLSEALGLGSTLPEAPGLESTLPAPPGYYRWPPCSQEN